MNFGMAWYGKKVTGLMKDVLGGKMLKEFVGLSAKTYSYLAQKSVS